MQNNKNNLFVVSILVLAVAFFVIAMSRYANDNKGQQLTQPASDVKEVVVKSKVVKVENDVLVGPTWVLKQYKGEDGKMVDATAAKSTAIFDGVQVNGSGGCNSYFASYQTEGNQIKMGPIGSTMMACEEAVLNQETGFFVNLDASRSFGLDPVNGEDLLFMDETGNTVLVMAKE